MNIQTAFHDDTGMRDSSPGAATWTVWRQDDSGSQFLVEANLTEARAKAMAAEFEARGHKQTYWYRDERIK